MLIVWLSLAADGRAHDPGLSSLVVGVRNGGLHAQFTFARGDAEMLLPAGPYSDGTGARAELTPARFRTDGFATNALRVMERGALLASSKTEVFLDAGGALNVSLEYLGGGFVGESNLRSLVLERLPRGHRQYVAVRDASGKLLSERVLDRAAPDFTVAFASTEASPPASGPTPTRFLALGIEHILTGYDHLLFLLGLLIAGGGWRSSLKIITSFTLAHSLTLGLAALDIVRFPSILVEPLIAASIVYVGIENICRPNLEHRWRLTFGFGLVHGFGFASALRELGLGSDFKSVAWPLLSFNFGVELGQLAIAALALPLIWKLQERPAYSVRCVPALSVLVTLAGGYWLLERTLFAGR